jgi:hypothetical protein
MLMMRTFVTFGGTAVSVMTSMSVALSMPLSWLTLFSAKTISL